MSHPHLVGRSRRFLRMFWRKLNEEHVFLYAAAVSFNIAITAFPLVLILFSVFGFVLTSEQTYAEVSRFIDALLPVLQRFGETGAAEQNLNEVMMSFIANRTAFAGISVIIFLFMVSGLYASMRGILNELWDVKHRRHILHSALRDLVVVGLVGTLLLVLALLMIVVGVIAQYRINLFGWQSISFAGLIRLVGIIFPILFMFSISFVVYRFLPDEQPPSRVALVCATVFTLLWLLAKNLFGLYVSTALPRLNAFYGSYTLLVMVAIWIYYSALIFVLSAIIGHAYRLTSFRFGYEPHAFARNEAHRTHPLPRLQRAGRLWRRKFKGKTE